MPIRRPIPRATRACSRRPRDDERSSCSSCASRSARVLRRRRFEDRPLRLFASQIAAFNCCRTPFIAPLALLLPFFEMMLGAYLLDRAVHAVAAWFGRASTGCFAAAIASAVVRGIVTSCGCFGPNDATKTSWGEVLRDVGIGCVIAFVAWRAPGRLPWMVEWEQGMSRVAQRPDNRRKSSSTRPSRSSDRRHRRGRACQSRPRRRDPDGTRTGSDRGRPKCADVRRLEHRR